MGYAYDYATAILKRGREPMPPIDFVPNWGDAPRRSKLYPGALSFPLPEAPPATAGVDTAIHAGNPTDDVPFTLAELGSMLRYSYGLLGRRLAPTANTDLPALPNYSHANWHRGTASGGGLYPCSIYWVAGAGAGVNPGVYYYSNPQHSMQRLLAGDVSGKVRAAVGEPAGDSRQFLVIGIKYWQNAFKYNNFSYHAVSMDVGTVLQTWQMWARPAGRRIAPVLWFDAAEIGRLLGLPADDEGLFAVVPLTWSESPTPAGGEIDTAVRVRRADRERSRVRITFTELQRIHETTAEAAPRRPGPGALSAAAALPAPDGVRVPLPEPEPMPMPLPDALRSRRSSFGRFEAAQPITAAELAASLAACHATEITCEINTSEDQPLTKLYAFVNHVAGIPAGSYEYDPQARSLVLLDPEAPGYFLQKNYFLANYNLEQAAVVIVPTIRTHAVLDAVGDRGYNVVNATIGAVSQSFYTAASALGLGCGVALGFDNISFIEQLDIAERGEAPLLIMLLGHERANSGNFRYELG